LNVFYIYAFSKAGALALTFALVIVLSALVRRRVAGLIHGFSNLSYEERLKNRTNDPGNKKIRGKSYGSIRDLKRF